MRILCEYSPCGPSYVRTGWGRVFQALGHDFRFWDQRQKPAFDIFSEFEPDILLACTYSVDRAMSKCIAARPHMKVAMYGSAWGPYLNDVDLKKYPLVVPSEGEKRAIEHLKKTTGKPDFVFIHAHDKWLHGTMSGWKDIGVDYHGILNAADTFAYLNGRPRPEFQCDVAFVGGYWGYKARNLDRYILPLCHPSTGLNVKVFGNQPWPVHNWLGLIDDADVKDLFASAVVCPNVSEPHSTDLGWDVIERPFKVFAAGGLCVSDHVEEAQALFGEDLLFAHNEGELLDMVRHFIKWPETREGHIKAGRRRVLLEHTYWDRVADMLDHFGLETERARCLRLKAEHIQGELS
jgi:hypothetical protein